MSFTSFMEIVEHKKNSKELGFPKPAIIIGVQE